MPEAETLRLIAEVAILSGLCVIQASIGLVQVYHALGGLPAIGALLYSLSLIWLLAMACLNFALLVLRPS